MKKRMLIALAPLLMLFGCAGKSSEPAKSDPVYPDVSVVCTKLLVNGSEVELTDETAQTINAYYHAADIGTEYFIDSAFAEHEMLFLSDGSTLTVDNYVTEYALMKQGDTKKVIQLAPDFYSYLKNLGEAADESGK